MSPHSRSSRSPVTGLLLLAFLLTPLPTQARPADLADAATERLDCGALYDAGDYPAAVGRFENLKVGATGICSTT